MEETRLPRNSKEGILYGFSICIVTATVMMLFNIGIQAGKIDGQVILKILSLLPIVIVVAMLIETFIVGKIAGILMSKFTEPSDGFNAKILFNILFCVTGMSAIMSIVGAMIGIGKISLEPIINWPTNWPRNFCIALWCEILLAQPFARFVMKKLHSFQAKKINKTNINNEKEIEKIQISDNGGN